MTEGDPKTHLLFEGCHEGKGQLKLVILKSENGTFTEIGEGPGVWLYLQEPNKFIQRWTCGDGDRTPVTGYTLDTGHSQRADNRAFVFWHERSNTSGELFGLFERRPAQSLVRV